MLYQVKRFRLMAALRVGLMGGALLGGIGGFLFLPFLVVSNWFLAISFNRDVIPRLVSFLSDFESFSWAIFYMIGLTIMGFIGGAIAGALMMSVLGFFYNQTTRYTGGLMVELEARGKLKEKTFTSTVNREARDVASLHDLLDEDDDPQIADAPPLARHSQNS
jgi:hypothetical protein